LNISGNQLKTEAANNLEGKQTKPKIMIIIQRKQNQKEIQEEEQSSEILRLVQIDEIISR